MVGVELGDKKKYAQVGAGYAHLEANAFPSMFVESDLYDGQTNREGWLVYGLARDLPQHGPEPHGVPQQGDRRVAAGLRGLGRRARTGCVCKRTCW